MGTPEFSVPTLSALVKNKLNIVNVYTQPPQKSKRGQKINASPVEEFCKKNSLNFRNPKNLNNEEELEFFKKLSPDLVVVVAYGQIISKSFLDVVKLGFINIHASLLPKWRGAAPIQRGLMNGDKKLGISIMKIEEKLDSGPILALKELEIDKHNTFGEVEKKLSIMGADLLLESLKVIEDGSPKFINQLHAEATYAKKIDKKETKINWNLDANKVLSHIHSLSPSPGAWFMYEKERIKVLKAKISTEQASPGRVLNDNLSIGCKVDSIQILELQRQGKSRQSHKEFLLGNKIAKNSILV